MLVAFWSNFHQTGTTFNTAAISAMTALEYRFNVLLAHSHFEKSSLETAFLDRKYINNELAELSGIGIDALARFIKFNAINKNNIANYTNTLLKNKMDILIGTNSTNKELYVKDLGDVIEKILNAAKDSYDLIFIDISSALNDLTKKILEFSDIVVINLIQNHDVLEDFFENYDTLEYFFEKQGDMKRKCIYLLGRYDKNSRYNLKNLQRKYKLKGNISIIPYNIEYSDACSDSKALEFLMKNLRADKDDNNYYFMSEVRKTVELILRKLKVNISSKKMGEC